MVREHACLHYRHYIRVVMFVCVYLYVYFIISVSVSRCAYVFVYTHQRERPVCLLYLYTSYISVKDLSVSILLIHLIYQFARLTDKNKCINHINPYRIFLVKTKQKKHLHHLSHSSSKENKYIQTFRTARTWIT